MSSKTQVKPVAVTGKWALMQEDYIAQNLRRSEGDPPFTLKMCAEAHKVSYLHLRQKASEQKWSQRLKERREQLREEALNKLSGALLFNEMETRTRQATYARLASGLAYSKLKSLTDQDVKDMSIKEAIELMKLGLYEERQALGLGDTFQIPPDGEGHDGKRVLSNEQVFAVARRVIELQRNDDGSYGEDAEATPGA